MITGLIFLIIGLTEGREQMPKLLFLAGAHDPTNNINYYYFIVLFVQKLKIHQHCNLCKTQLTTLEKNVRKLIKKLRWEMFVEIISYITIMRKFLEICNTRIYTKLR